MADAEGKQVTLLTMHEFEAARSKEWTFCLVHEKAVTGGSCADCGGDRNLIQVAWTGNADKYGRI